jgi:hypothetical protein
VTDYRAYTIGLAGRIIGYEPLACGSDEEAIKKATSLIRKHDIELWSGERLVVRLKKPPGANAIQLKGSPDKGKPGEMTTLELKDGRMVPKAPKVDLEAEALEALAKARALPHGPERAEALKKAGTLQNIAHSQGISYAKRGRPVKRK